MPSTTQTAERKNAAMYGARDGRRCIDCRTWPTDWRSSLAARWTGLTSSIAAGIGARPTVSCKNRSSSIGGALRLGRGRGRSEATPAVIFGDRSAAGGGGGGGAGGRGGNPGSPRAIWEFFFAPQPPFVGIFLSLGFFGPN